ncbi:hypothetical protein Acsp04_42990 [Actinomadura sp. NBRC 104425]|uniref:hypothetical protein n=1 Tax=Actinomadura sp. NBRC 104425 TaxID=3032204 RepID=UPI0024A2BE34|nr:hypothetical protein [Actinomadura sp. NBRC 104425]GLZ14064.1 hypothetical protein Acsp04_42990 [Actinomadura sp. NBRC 104425]
MTFLGVLLIAVAAVVGVGVVLDNPGDTTLTVFGSAVPGVNNQWQVFFAGALFAVVLVIGMVLTCMGTARTIRTRREVRALREEREESLTTLEMEKRRLERELARIRNSAAASAARQATAAPASPAAPAPAPGPRSAARSQVKAASPFFDRSE